MKKFHIFILFALMTVLTPWGLSSCSESTDEPEEYADWQKTNEQYFDKKYSEVKSKVDAGNADWKILRSWTLEETVATHSYDHVLVNVLKAGNGSGCPLYTDSVKVHYSGRQLPSPSYPGGMIFDQSWTGDYNLDTMTPSTFAVNGLVVGFSTALQYMHIGDRWQVTIPHQLGYGAQAKPNAPYSTMIFDITLVGYYRADDNHKAAPAKNGSGNNAGRGHWVYE